MIPRLSSLGQNVLDSSVLLYIPCVATLGAIYRELGSGWTVFSALWTTGVAYVTAVGFYQASTFLRHPGASMIWLTAIAAAVLVAWVGLKYVARRARGV